MGAYQIWHIEFLDKKSRKYFESLKLHKRVLCSFCSWKEGYGEVIYFMGYNGYALGEDFLNKHSKKLNLKKFYSLDLSTRTNWCNELNEFKKTK